MAVYGTCNDCMVLSNGLWSVSGSTTPIFIDVVNENNQSLDVCLNVTTEVFRTNPKIIELDDCGCPVDDCDRASLRIKISRKQPQSTDCGFKSFSLKEGGLVSFVLYDNTETTFMNSECCSSLGFTPEIENGIYVCRWQEKDDELDCSQYTPISIDEDGYQEFIELDGSKSTEITNAECCPIGFAPELQSNGKYKCKDPNRTDDKSHQKYTAISVSNNYIVWNTGTGTTQYVDSKEYCNKYSAQTISEVYGYRCRFDCADYENIKYGVNGLVTFFTANETPFTDVRLTTCCPFRTVAEPTASPDDLPYYKCYLR